MRDTGIEGLALRDYQPSDRNYLLATMWRSLSRRHAISQRERERGWATMTEKWVDQVGALSDISILCNAEDAHNIVAYAIAGPIVVSESTQARGLYWAYTPVDLRKLGFARLVINDVLDRALDDKSAIKTALPWPYGDKRFVLDETTFTFIKKGLTK